MTQTWTFVPEHLDQMSGERVGAVWRLVTVGDDRCPVCGKSPRVVSWAEPEAHAHDKARQFIETTARRAVEAVGPCPCGGEP